MSARDEVAGSGTIGSDTISSDTGPARSTSAVRRRWIAVAIVVGGLVVVDLLAQGLDRAVGGDQPGGATGSSYATAADGLAAYSSLLSHYHYGVERQRGSIAHQQPPADATVFVLEPSDLTVDGAATLLQFVTAGGRLVVGGESPFYLRNLRDTAPQWQAAGTTSWTEIDSSLGNVRDIEGTGVGSWSSSGSGRALVGRDGFALLTRDQVGRGEIFFLADASPLENASLATADNAAFGLALAGGDARRPVVFAEGVHGYGASRGLAAIPDRWKVALILVALAALAFVWSRARRFGPPDRRGRDLPPARAQYVQALSVSLERTRDHAGALGPAQRWACARVAARAGLGANADTEELARAARSFGCAPDEIAALLAPVSDDASVLALGRAVARVGGNGRMQ
ncbi:MAG TPA: DUF4350 domain-containing protein [Acidimicrobiia bacterium]